MVPRKQFALRSVTFNARDFLSTPPALLGLDDVDPDVTAELKHRETRWTA